MPIKRIINHSVRWIRRIFEYRQQQIMQPIQRTIDPQSDDISLKVNVTSGYKWKARRVSHMSSIPGSRRDMEQK
jgi:hypothetical protein